MITDVSTQRYHSDKHFSEFLRARWRQKSTGIDMEQNYITATMCIVRYKLYQFIRHKRCVKSRGNFRLIARLIGWSRVACIGWVCIMTWGISPHDHFPRDSSCTDGPAVARPSRAGLWQDSGTFRIAEMGHACRLAV